MKKTLLAVLLAIVSISTLAAEAPKFIKFDVTVTKDGKIIAKSSLTTQDGQVVPLQTLTEHTYRAQASRGNDGKINITPGTFQTGFFASLKPEVQKDGKINTDVFIDVSDLTAMKKITSDDGLTIDMPEVSQAHINQKVTFTSDVPVVLNSGGYTIKVSARSI
jgi:hypothetical protein